VRETTRMTLWNDHYCPVELNDLKACCCSSCQASCSVCFWPSNQRGIVRSSRSAGCTPTISL